MKAQHPLSRASFPAPTDGPFRWAWRRDVIALSAAATNWCSAAADGPGAR